VFAGSTFFAFCSRFGFVTSFSETALVGFHVVVVVEVVFVDDVVVVEVDVGEVAVEAVVVAGCFLA